MTTMTAGQTAMLRNLGRIFEVSITAADRNPPAALEILSGMFVCPAIPEKSVRRKALNDIRAPITILFGEHSPFMYQTSRHHGTMQALPGHYAEWDEDTEALVTRHESIKVARTFIKAVGAAPGAGAVGAGVAEWMKERDVRAGVRRGAHRAIGHGPLMEQVSRSGIGGRLALGLGGVAISAAFGVAYLKGGERLAEIEAILIHRFQSGEMTAEQYARVFGDAVDPAAIRKYWEM